MSKIKRKTRKLSPIIFIVVISIIFAGCSIEDFSVSDNGNDEFEAKFSADKLRKFTLNIQNASSLLHTNGEITVYLDGYELGTIENEETVCFYTKIDPGEYTLSVKEKGKLGTVKEKVTVPDFTDSVWDPIFEPAMIVLYKNSEIKWMANDNENYGNPTIDREEYVILPGTEDAVK